LTLTKSLQFRRGKVSHRTYFVLACDLKTGCVTCYILAVKNKGKAVPLQTWSSPDGSRKLRFPDYMTTA